MNKEDILRRIVNQAMKQTADYIPIVATGLSECFAELAFVLYPQKAAIESEADYLVIVFSHPGKTFKDADPATWLKIGGLISVKAAFFLAQQDAPTSTRVYIKQVEQFCVLVPVGPKIENAT